MSDDDITLLSYADLEAAGFGHSTTIRRKWKAGKFPKPIDIGDGRPRWRAKALHDWLEARSGAATEAEGRGGR